jgi:hypothetical protein
MNIQRIARTADTPAATPLLHLFTDADRLIIDSLIGCRVSFTPTIFQPQPAAAPADATRCAAAAIFLFASFALAPLILMVDIAAASDAAF